MTLTRRSALLVLVLAMAVLVSPAPLPTLMIGNTAVLLLVAVDVLLAASPRALVLSRQVPPTGRLGEALPVTLLVQNPGPRTLRAVVRDAWPPSAGLRPATARLEVPPGERRRLSAVLTPTRRGDRSAVSVTVRATGPLRLAGRQRQRVVPGRVRVLPPFRSRRHLPEKLVRLRVVEGMVETRGYGRGTEFDSLREYVPGDDVRAVDWRASARRETLAVKVYRPERDRRIIIVLDTGRTSAARVGDEPRLDAALDAALLLAALAARAGDRVDLLAYDAVPRALAQRGTIATFSEAMAGLEPALLEVDHAGLVAQVMRLASRRALVVLLTDLVPPVVEEGLLPSLAPLVSRHQLLVGAVTDPRVEALAGARGEAAALYGAAAAERTAAERARVAGLLRARGVEVVEAAPSRYASAVSDAYLALKAAGRL